MKERPILFSGPMVRALLDGSKTQTRRVVKPQPVADLRFVGGAFIDQPKSKRSIAVDAPYVHKACPHGHAGDRLYVRETHEVNRIGFEEGPNTPARHYAGVKYKADDGRAEFSISDALYRDLDSKESRGWTPSIHMPRWASRIMLEVTGVRVERVQQITDADAFAEGCPADATWPLEWYRDLWDSLKPAAGAAWADNPWVWVVEFKRITS